MDTEWFGDFLALLDAGGFARAAEKRSLSQPSFSRRMRSLEQWVGVTLIDRSSHTFRLTKAGERFRSVAEEIARLLQLGREETRAVAKVQSETLHFVSTHVLSLAFFPRWLTSLETTSPLEATIELTAADMTACERLMVEGRAQFLLCHHHEAAATRMDSGFRSIVLGHDRLLRVATPRLLRSGPVGGLPLLAFTAQSGMGRILASTAGARGTPMPPPSFSSHLASVLTAMARDGRGVAWSAASLVEEDLAAGTLVRVGGPAEDVLIEIRLWRPKVRQSPAAEALWSRLLKARSREIEAA